jgi:hypothetical protein
MNHRTLPQVGGALPALALILALLLLGRMATGGVAAFGEVQRSVETTGAGDLGFGCVQVPSVDDSDRFGPFFAMSSIPLFATGIASQLSAVNPSAVVFGDGSAQIAGAPTCPGTSARSAIELSFEVSGQIMVVLEGSLNADGNVAVHSRASVSITALPSGRTVYSIVAESGLGALPAVAVLDSPIILGPGQYLLTIDAGCSGALVGEEVLGSAGFNVSIDFPAVLNNECASAEVIELDGFFVFDTSFATTEGPPELLCGEGDSPVQIDADVWFRYSSACDAWLILTTCGLADFDTRMALYEGCPQAGGTILACNDDDDECFGGTSQLLVPVRSGVEYLVRIGGADGARGVGGLLVTCEIPNDYCEDLLKVGVGTIPFSTVGATTDGPVLAGPCAGSDGAADSTQIHSDIWFELVAPCRGGLRVRVEPEGEFASRVAIYEGACPLDASAELGCGVAAPGESASETTISVELGQSYVIRMGGAEATPPSERGGQVGHGVLIIECVACPADLDGDLLVSGSDLGLMLAAWGSADRLADLDGSGVVDGADLGEVLAAWGPCW